MQLKLFASHHATIDHAKSDPAFVHDTAHLHPTEHLTLHHIEHVGDGNQTDLFQKAATHKYVKRERTASGKYRYWYKLPNGGLVTSQSLHKGAKFKHHDGHYEITHHDEETGHVHFKHDVTGETKKMHHDDFREHVHSYHADTLKEKKAATLDRYQRAKKHGSKKQVARQRRDYLKIKRGYGVKREKDDLSAKSKSELRAMWSAEQKKNGSDSPRAKKIMDALMAKPVQPYKQMDTIGKMVSEQDVKKKRQRAIKTGGTERHLQKPTKPNAYKQTLGEYTQRHPDYERMTELEPSQGTGFAAQTKIGARIAGEHRDAVRAALKSGKDVHPDVLADYPDLVETYGVKRERKEPKETAPITEKVSKAEFKDRLDSLLSSLRSAKNSGGDRANPSDYTNRVDRVKANLKKMENSQLSRKNAHLSDWAKEAIQDAREYLGNLPENHVAIYTEKHAASEKKIASKIQKEQSTGVNQPGFMEEVSRVVVDRPGGSETKESQDRRSNAFNALVRSNAIRQKTALKDIHTLRDLKKILPNGMYTTETTKDWNGYHARLNWDTPPGGKRLPPVVGNGPDNKTAIRDLYEKLRYGTGFGVDSLANNVISGRLKSENELPADIAEVKWPAIQKRVQEIRDEAYSRVVKLTPYPKMTDKQILDAVKKNQQQAVTELYNRHFDYMVNVANKITRNRDDAQDVAAEVFARITTDPGGYKADKGTFKAWLGTVVSNAAKNRVDTQRNPERSDVGFDDLAPGTQFADEAPEATPDHPELMRTIQSALAALKASKPKSYQVAKLKWLDGFSNQEIADRLGVQVGSVKKTAQRAKADLEAIIKTDFPAQAKFFRLKKSIAHTSLDYILALLARFAFQAPVDAR